MPFQREDITLPERIRLVTTMIDKRGQYGVVSELARDYRLSRQSLYAMLRRGQEVLAHSLVARPPGRLPLARTLLVDKNRLDRAVVTLTVAGHASLEGVQTCLAEVFDVHRSTGYVSTVLDEAGGAAHAFLERVCPPQPIRADLDEIFTGATPHLVVVDHDSTLILALQRTTSRDSTAWGVTLLDQQAKGVVICEAASDSARGIVAGIADAELACIRLGDLFHVVRDLMVVAGRLERVAYGAIDREEQVRLVEAEAQTPHPRRGPKRRSDLSIADAVIASQAAIRRSDDYCWLVGVVRETLEPLDARSGRLHAASWSRPQLGAVASLLREMTDPRVAKVAGRLERATDELVAYQDELAKQVAPWIAQVGEETVALIGWAWRHRQALGLTTLGEAAAAFPVDQQEAVKAIWAILDRVHRGSSLVECINSLLRPHLLVHRGADQGLLDLLACYLNHRVFSRGKRRGKSPLQLAGVAGSEDWLVTIGFAPKRSFSTPPSSKEANGRRQAESVNRLAA